MNFINRFVRVLRLDRTVFDEILQDSLAIGQAITVVLLAGISASAGMGEFGNIRNMTSTFVGLFLGWLAWSAIVYLVATRFMQGAKMGFWKLFTVLGYTNAAGVFYALGALPGLQDTGIIMLLSSSFTVAAMVIALMQVFSFSVGRVLLLCAVGWFLQLLGLFLFIRAVGIVIALLMQSPS